MPVIQCPGCEKKLKLKAIRPGAKVKCPGCAQVFQADAAVVDSPGKSASAEKPAASRSQKASPKQRPAGKAAPAKKRPVKKRPPAPASDDLFDEFDDDEFADDEFGDEYGDDDFGGQPARSSRPAGRGKAASKKPAKQKSKLPLILAGVAVLAAAGGGAAFFLMGGDDEADGDTVAATDSDDSGNASADPDVAAVAPEGGSDAAPAAVATPATGGEAVGQGDLQWLPSSTEGVVHLKVPQLLSGPLGSLTQIPDVAGQIDQFRSVAGFGPEDIDSVTVGISRLSEMARTGKELNPDQVAPVGVFKTKKTIDLAVLSKVEPRVTQKTNGSQSYYLIPDGPGLAFWAPDDKTVVVGVESAVTALPTQSLSSSTFDAGLLNGTSSIEIAVSPTDPDAIFKHPAFQIPQNTPQPIPPPLRTLVGSIRQNVVGVSLGITLTQDLGFRTAFRCRDEAGARQFGETFQSVTDELEKMEQANGGPQVPPGMEMIMGPFQGISDQMSESFQITTAGTLTQSTAEAKGGGQTLQAMIPLAAGLLMPAIQSARTAARSTQSRNNMKQMGLAMFNFHDVFGRFPNSTGKGPNGERWLSWRVHLLPYLGHKDLYDRFALKEPWDSPTNRPLVNLMPDVYKSPSIATEPGKTPYLVPVSKGTLFEDESGRALREITDGTSNTIMMVEVAAQNAVYWTQPQDFEVPATNPMSSLHFETRPGARLATVLMADASLRTLTPNISVEVIKNLFQIADGQAVTIP